ncbi:hypothetical protein [Nannocystis bainbridge]|uniref:Uncharacterized protein n=1 Tax=Nannocystis bainbridge TaxID=2995303 RepID=A0ABT5E0F2_9BACT|nr:hypothetical protein [Nannocystis bainbridge]MDC0719310.1 hypothetical protein [Nannocystis bainbridge]
MGPLLDYLPLVAAVGLVVVLAGLVRAHAKQQAAPGSDAGEGLVRLRPRQPVDTGGLLALAGLGFALALALVLFAPTAAVCLSSTTCPEGPALWVSAAGLGLLGLATAIAWPSLTRAP